MAALEGTAIAELGDGLVLRTATGADSEALAAFNARVHGSGGRLDEGTALWVRDLMSGRHPTCGPGDFTVVEDRQTGAIVSSLNLISQRWSYGGVELAVGRPELVGTLPEYRRRGLIRRQMEVVHRWSAERGELMQAITGIPWYYRQFGYEMALQLYTTRHGYRDSVPALGADGEEPYRLRPATAADLPVIATLYEGGRRRALLACVRDAPTWRYELSGRGERSSARRELMVIQPALGGGTTPGAPLGFLAHRPVSGATVSVVAYELAPEASWIQVTPTVLRYLAQAGEAGERAMPGARFERYSFSLGANHPVYRAAPIRFPHARRPSVHYVRVPDLPRFLRHVAPVLESRLEASVARGFTGQLRLNFYRDGVHLALEGGRIMAVERWARPERGEAGASLPDLTFLQLLFGHRSLDELEHAFGDCFVGAEPARVLLEALFPPQPSEIWALD